MIVGKVIGNVVSTIATADYEARTVLVIQPISPDGKNKGKTFLAIDTVQAGVGDTVLALDEGGSAKMILDTKTVKQIIVGIVDHIIKED